MKDTNHLPIDKSLKKHLNSQLKTFRKYRFSEGVVASTGKKKKAFLDILFDEYDSMGDMMKALF
ncbi:hypothetical protein SAMN04489761_0698 [Tenacibaculum sp. MAR_2009_124]|uniref:hypothetical protein n=1 Tax=Tenacibaculum sp. MAR_2009_124 TaxID=1250059 RepID=UPI00089CAB29|nr:hypothetical protein [Tenacibaculum sp. MAR_2009_124]SEB43544.1 hypothetical protein SAMN04489761_0698 [Tenacibaculum sp. MAR_2009_124]